MKQIKSFVHNQPALAAALLPLFGVIIGLFIHDAALVTSLVGVFAALLGIHHVVTPVTTMVEKVTEATTKAATDVARDLGQTTVGTVGEVADTATDIVDNVIDLTLGHILTDKERNGYDHGN